MGSSEPGFDLFCGGSAFRLEQTPSEPPRDLRRRERGGRRSISVRRKAQRYPRDNRLPFRHLHSDSHQLINHRSLTFFEHKTTINWKLKQCMTIATVIFPGRSIICEVMVCNTTVSATTFGRMGFLLILAGTFYNFPTLAVHTALCVSYLECSISFPTLGLSLELGLTVLDCVGLGWTFFKKLLPRWVAPRTEYCFKKVTESDVVQ